MAYGKHGRQDRKPPSFYVMITTVIFVALCLVAVWWFSYPAEPLSLDETEEVLDENSLSDMGKDKPAQLTEKNNEKNEEETLDEEMDLHKSESPKTKKKSPDPEITETNESEGDVNQEKSSDEEESPDGENSEGEGNDVSDDGNIWKLCTADCGADCIPCLDNTAALKLLHSTKHYVHRERHCPEEPPTCLVPLPEGYRTPIRWPLSRNEVWYKNVPHTGLATYKKDQNWVMKSGDRLIFPGGGTQFKNGVSHYIEYIEKTFPEISWGKTTRVILDVGCGVASFGGYLLDRGVLAMSFAPKDEHEAQVQFALERGIPAILAVMGTERLVFPSNVFDAVHCARCRVLWHADGGQLLLELNRVLRPGGYFVWSATPVYLTGEEDAAAWKAMIALTKSMCWEMLMKSTDVTTGVGFAVFQKPKTNTCYKQREEITPPMCDEDDKPNAAWYVPMTPCLHKIPTASGARSKVWPAEWPARLEMPPTWLENVKGLYGKQGTVDFQEDLERWQRVLEKSYETGLGINWKGVRNVMDMRAVYGGFAASLANKPLWVMNVVPTDGPDTLPIIFDRGLLGVYHDWCESFNTYPRTYDLLHANHLFMSLKNRCNLTPVVVEMDRILRPGGWAIIRDRADVLSEIKGILKSLKWKIGYTYTYNGEGYLAARKTLWRPDSSSV